jgi:hypothetical protein
MSTLKEPYPQEKLRARRRLSLTLKNASGAIVSLKLRILISQHHICSVCWREMDTGFLANIEEYVMDGGQCVCEVLTLLSFTTADIQMAQQKTLFAC